ncbi:ribosylnicotinamide kinase [Zalerion maritima]|uniref:Ribosylnicotinamide kinase n=1 Tax=Zalerion maritima TaxID=339359 RepID=A0AAD5RIW8_9PEZI|nr:ribosylnicotinamide kinase [Zalerion maritima]
MEPQPTTSPTRDAHQTLMVGISGCSSSGKTTLARLLRDLFPRAFIIHEDDFYRAESELPVRNGLTDWDCVEAIDVPQMAEALKYIRARGEVPVSLQSRNESRTNHGIAAKDRIYLPERLLVAKSSVSDASPESMVTAIEKLFPEQRSIRVEKNDQATETPACHDRPTPVLPPTTTDSPSLSIFSASSSAISLPIPSTAGTTPLTTDPTSQPTLDSKEDQNTVGIIPVRKSFLEDMKSRVDSWLATLPKETTTPKICITDGFLLYMPALEPVPQHLDLRMFLLVSRQKATQRREARDGYVTMEGFWKDPPGYVDAIVWPNYADAHAWMFKDGDCEKGILDPMMLEKEGIKAQVDKGMDVDMETTLDWAVGQLMETVEGYLGVEK